MTTSVLLRKNKKGQCNSHYSLKELCGLSSVLCSLAGTRYFMGYYEYLLLILKQSVVQIRMGDAMGFFEVLFTRPVSRRQGWQREYMHMYMTQILILIVLFKRFLFQHAETVVIFIVFFFLSLFFAFFLWFPFGAFKRRLSFRYSKIFPFCVLFCEFLTNNSFKLTLQLRYRIVSSHKKFLCVPLQTFLHPSLILWCLSQ